MFNKNGTIANAETQRNILLRANSIGRDLKGIDKMGKEYFAFCNINGTTILDWVEGKVHELVIGAAKKCINIVGVTYDLTGKHVFKLSDSDGSMIYVHKKRFKRFVKKAVQRNLNKI